MKIVELDLFATPILVIKGFLSAAELEIAIDFLNSKKEYLHSHKLLSNKSLSTFVNTSKFDPLFELKENFKEWSFEKDCVMDRLFESIRYLSAKTKIRFNKMDVSWMNFQTKGSKLKSHTHRCNFAGALFLNVSDNSSPIVFENPSKLREFVEKEDEVYDFVYGSEYAIKPHNGDLIIFPGYLFHGSGDFFNQDDNRIVISFNVL